MPCSFGTKAILKLSPPLEPLPLPPLEAEPPLPCPHAVRVSSAARPREAVSLVVRVILIGHLWEGGSSRRCHRLGEPVLLRSLSSVRWGAAPAGGRRPEFCPAAVLRPVPSARRCAGTKFGGRRCGRRRRGCHRSRPARRGPPAARPRCPGRSPPPGRSARAARWRRP